MFQKHPSKSLHELYQIKNFQGANPRNAKVLFVGKDPNWSAQIENEEIFDLVVEYLNDGETFWKKYNVHHPFLHSSYKGDGKKYHQAVSRIGLSAELSENISFVELIGFPTTGMSSIDYKTFNSYLLSTENRNHLIELDELLQDQSKVAFLFWGMIEQIKFIHKHTGLFKFLTSIDKNKMNRTDLNKVGNIYFHKHFSMGISSNTIRKIGHEISLHLN